MKKLTSNGNESMSRKEAQDLLVEINRYIRKVNFDPESFAMCWESFKEVFRQYDAILENLKDTKCASMNDPAASCEVSKT